MNDDVLSQTITVPTLGSNTGFSAVQTYTYDELNRLKSATENVTPHGGSQSQSWKQTYTFDRYGNRRFDFTSGNTTSPASNCTEAICNPTVSTSNNRLTSTGWQYDNAGNTTRDGEYRTFTYDGENKQILAKNSSNTTIGEYLYDGDGKRVKKIVPSTGETTVFVYDAAGKLIGEYSTIVANSTDAKVVYLTNDHLGSPRITTDAIGQTTSRRDFMPFGEEIARTGYGSDTVREKFATYERDAETDLDFAQERTYALFHGRFLSPDPLLSSGRIEEPKSWNRYLYVLDNPLKYVDPTGLYEWGASLGGPDSDAELLKRKGGQAIVDRRNEIRNAFTAAADQAAAGALSGNITSAQAGAIFDALAAYGSEGVANGVTLESGKVKNGAEAETAYTKDSNGKVAAFSSDEKGKVTTHVTVTFGEGRRVNANTVAHEGSHTSDRQALGRAFERSLQTSDLTLTVAGLTQNITQFETELRAYRVDSYLDQANNIRSQVWNRGWNAVDRDRAIKSLLKSSGVYKLTPEKPGLQLYTEK